jgi:hypothetical protein
MNPPRDVPSHRLLVWPVIEEKTDSPCIVQRISTGDPFGSSVSTVEFELGSAKTWAE